MSGVYDALREFMNVVCGQFITACHGTDRVFNLSIPTAVECAESPQFNFDDQQLVIPSPLHAREDIQEPFVRDHEIPPEKYYPEGYHPELLTEWPVDGDLVVPLDAAPPEMTDGMGESWRQRRAYDEWVRERLASDEQ